MKELPVTQRVLGRVLQMQASQHGDRPFLDFRGEVVVSYKQLDEFANRFAHGFLKRGIRKGMKVAIMLPNCPEYLYCWFGLAKIGAVMVPINTAHKGDLLQYMLNQSDAEAVVTNIELLPRLRAIEHKLAKTRQMIVHGWQGDFEPLSIKTSTLAEFVKAPAESPHVEVRHSDPMSILFTSGTTGPSKGVVMSHHYYYHAAKTIGSSMGDGPNDVLYTCLPLFHVNAQVCTVLAALLFDARVAMYEHFSASSFWHEIRRSRATVFLALGMMGNILYKAPPRSDDADNHVRLAMVVPPPEDLAGFEQRFGLQVVYETFGMTEGIVAPPVITTPRRPGCCGKPAAETQVQIVDDEDNPVGPRQIGEIVMRPAEPYTMMSEYYNMPEETLQSFRNLWFHTGDLGYMDEDGYLYFVGRKKEAIRRRGENISAFEVEQIVNQHPSVLESAAIAVPSEWSEDDVKIVVVLKEGEQLEPEELIRFCESRMAYFMVPRYVEFRHELPKTPTQRVEKYKLQAEGNGPKTWDRERGGYRLNR
ncbi:MAG: ATP-dependent acyl-CoA ligase [Acidobacteriota bacterium]|nr:ATP-dependent acyl-CoA ligase [Blastocatellia bacterium]MDW8240913.1 ATP-dependent acyl-CoA ligase [Acidobacteriota bacterium]